MYLTLRFYLYGDQSAAAASPIEPAWRDWLGQRFMQPEAEPSVA